MNEPSIARVEEAVRAVLAEFGRARSQATVRSTTVFPGKLLAQRHVEELAPGTGTLQVAPGTVITPLARDLLKKRRVEVRWIHQRAAAAAGTFGFAIESTTGLAMPLRRLLLTSDVRWEEVEPDSMSDWLLNGPDRGLALLTERPALRVWEACRRPGVRAAAVSETTGLAHAIEQIGLNLLVAGPSGQSPYSLKGLFEAFRRAGAPRSVDHEDRRSDRAGDLFASPSQLETRAVSHRPPDALNGAYDGFVGPGRGSGRF